MTTDTTGTPVLYVPDGFEGSPTTVADALDRTAALLDEEGRWTRGEWFRQDNRDDPRYREDPFCDGWSCCAEGALRLVTVGVRWGKFTWIIDNRDVNDSDLYEEARRTLLETINELHGESSGSHYRFTPGGPRYPGFAHVPSFNDHYAPDRSTVVAAVRAAADKARA